MSAAADLADYLASAPAFSWRSNHCGHHAAGWVKRRTGRDPLADMRTAGRNAALAIVRDHGNLPDAVIKLTGWQPVPHLTAQAGDLVMIPTDSAIGGALGICGGRLVAVSSAGGIVWADIMLCTHAWRMPA